MIYVDRYGHLVRQANTQFGWVQVSVLRQIGEQTEDVVAAKKGRRLDAMLDLHGRASLYSGRYLRAVTYAVDRHNAGVCPSNCPLLPTTEIVWGPVGPRGGQGYYVQPRTMRKAS